MNIIQLKELVSSGEFHHATYRNMGTLWEGLWIYKKYEGLRGFIDCGCFAKDNLEFDEAQQLVRHTGVSVGSYGRG